MYEYADMDTGRWCSYHIWFFFFLWYTSLFSVYCNKWAFGFRPLESTYSCMEKSESLKRSELSIVNLFWSPSPVIYESWFFTVVWKHMGLEKRRDRRKKTTKWWHDLNFSLRMGCFSGFSQKHPLTFEIRICFKAKQILRKAIRFRSRDPPKMDRIVRAQGWLDFSTLKVDPVSLPILRLF